MTWAHAYHTTEYTRCAGCNVAVAPGTWVRWLRQGNLIRVFHIWCAPDF